MKYYRIRKTLFSLVFFLLPVCIISQELVIDPAHVDSRSNIRPSSIKSEDGRAFVGYCEFTVKIDPGNQGVLLKRKFDKGIENQKGLVSVNGTDAGEWFTPGKPEKDELFIAESDFTIHESLTKGKDKITIRIRFGGGSVDWNEFSYKVLSNLGGEYIETDSLDIGNTASEQSHKYTIHQQTWEGVREFSLYYTNVVLPIKRKKLNEGDVVIMDGRAFKGSSEFIIRFNPDNEGILLRRAYHKFVPNQRGAIYVNGIFLGEWFEKGGGSDLADSNFFVPAPYTRGYSSLKVKVVFISSDNDWNEFYYWIFCKTGGKYSLEDSLDVGNTSDENFHGYKIENQTWNGIRIAQVVNSDIDFPREDNANISRGEKQDTAPDLAWYTDFNEAQTLSRTSNRPLLMVFYNPGHISLQVVESHLFNNPAAESLLRQFVLLKVDIKDSANRSLVESCQIFKIPCVVVRSPSSGEQKSFLINYDSQWSGTSRELEAIKTSLR